MEPETDVKEVNPLFGWSHFFIYLSTFFSLFFNIIGSFIEINFSHEYRTLRGSALKIFIQSLFGDVL